MQITTGDIFKRISQDELFRYYLHRDPTQHGLVTNPLRKDSNPGCSFFTSNTGRVYFNDFAANKKYDIIDVVKHKYKLYYRDALIKINDDFSLGLFGDKPKPIKKTLTQEYKKKIKLIQAVSKEFNQFELDYWKQYGISLETLKYFNVFSVKEVYVNKKPFWKSTPSDPIFGYLSPKTNKIKLYRPLTKFRKDKWLGSVSGKDVQGDLQLPFVGDLLFITSSLKDVMCLYELGYDAIAPQQESTRMHPPYIEGLKATFNEVVLFYDNDGEFFPSKGKNGKGKEASFKFSFKHDIDYILIPDGEPKDISDFYAKYGKKETEELLIELIKNK